MIDYGKNQNYKLGSPHTDDVYIGHTTQPLHKRKAQHVCDAKDPNRNCTSQLIVNAGDCYIILLEDFPCKNKKEATARERWWIENNPCVNKYIPGRSMEEYHVANKEKYNKLNLGYYYDNKEHLLAKQIKYYHDNKERISAKAKIYRDKTKAKTKAYHKQRNEWAKSCDYMNRINIH